MKANADIQSDAMNNALAAARRRGTETAAEILNSCDMLTVRTFAALIRTSPKTVNQQRKGGDLLGIAATNRSVRFPRWQLTDDGHPLPSLRSLFEILGGDPWTVFRVLTQRRNELNGETALEAIKSGRLEAVQEIARNLRAGVFAKATSSTPAATSVSLARHWAAGYPTLRAAGPTPMVP